MRNHFLIAAAVCAAGCASLGRSSSSSSNTATTAAITPRDLELRLNLIADDSMMGRESGSEGDYKAAAYVASEFRRLGLEPAGDSGTYFQTVPLWVVKIDPTSRLDAGGTALELGRDFLLSTATMPVKSVNFVPIYAGPLNDSTRWISADQGAGKLVVFGVPAGTSIRGVRLPSTRFSAAAYAFDALELMPAEGVARLREGRPSQIAALDDRANAALLLSRAGVAKIFGAPLDAVAPGTTGRALNGHYGGVRAPVAYPARNVVGILRGSDPALRGEYVSLTAHNDHVGFDHFPVDHDSLRAFNRVIRPMGADSPPREPTPNEWTRIRAILDSLRTVHRPRLDSIRNGADDDGSGTVSILEIAEAMAKGSMHPRRSVLFVSHTGEEAGLLGSKWYTDHATVPLDSVVGEIDQDMIGRGTATDMPRGGTGAGGPTYLEVVGLTRLSRAFGATIDSANARQPVPFAFNLEYDQPGHPLQYYCRADHFSYARYGIPSVALSRGEHLDYHQVTDEAQYIDYADLARVSKFVYDAAMMLADAPQRPSLDVPKPADPHGPCRQ